MLNIGRDLASGIHSDSRLNSDQIPNLIKDMCSASVSSRNLIQPNSIF